MTTVHEIEAWRVAEGLTKKELAARLEMSEVYLGRVLNGKIPLSAGVIARFKALASNAQGPAAHQQVIPLVVRFSAEEWADLQLRVPPGTDLEELIRGELLSRVLTRARDYVDRVLMAEEDTDSE